MDSEKRMDKEVAELRGIYQVIHDDIKYAKRLQWTMTYYALLTLAAIVGFSSLIYERMGFICLVQQLFYAPLLAIPAAFVNLMAIYNLMHTQYRLSLYRMMLMKTEILMTRTARWVLELNPKRTDEQKIDDIVAYKRYFWELTVPFVALLMIGFFFVLWYVLPGEYNLTYFLLVALLVIIIDVPAIFLWWRHFHRETENKKDEVFFGL